MPAPVTIATLLRAAALIAAGLSADGARAQMVLPGAMPAAPEGTTAAPPAGGPVKPATPAPIHAPGDAAVGGLDLQLNGARGLMAFERADAAGLRIRRLVLPGDQIARSGGFCRVEIEGGKVPLTKAPRTEGLVSYSADLAACPFRLDILDGAVRVSRPAGAGACEIRDADCRVDPAGLWGPPGGSMTGERVKQFEHARARAEADIRTTFRLLLAGAKDKTQIKDLASEQAAFSSKRTEYCEAYAQEDVHGFCTLRFTEARLIALNARLHPKSDLDEARPKPVVRKPRAKPSLPPGETLPGPDASAAAFPATPSPR